MARARSEGVPSLVVSSSLRMPPVSLYRAPLFPGPGSSARARARFATEVASHASTGTLMPAARQRRVRGSSETRAMFTLTVFGHRQCHFLSNVRTQRGAGRLVVFASRRSVRSRLRSDIWPRARARFLRGVARNAAASRTRHSMGHVTEFTALRIPTALIDKMVPPGT